MIKIANSDGSWMLLPPEQSRDREMLELLNHEETMLPHLPALCPMSWPDMQLRRSDHRRGFFNGRNFCLDIVTSDGMLVGTTGFREVKVMRKQGQLREGTAEWGAIIHKSHQRKGICKEAYRACEQEAAKRWPGITIIAKTTSGNEAMLKFLGKMKKGGYSSFTACFLSPSKSATAFGEIC